MGDIFRSIVLGLGGNNGAKGAAHSRLVALVAPLRGVWAAAVKRKVPWRQHPDGEGRGGRVRWFTTSGCSWETLSPGVSPLRALDASPISAGVSSLPGEAPRPTEPSRVGL